MVKINEYSDGNISIIKLFSRPVIVPECKPPNNVFNLEYKILSGKINILRKWNTNKKITRYSNGYIIEELGAKKERVKKSFAFLGPKLWNHLPPNLRNDEVTKIKFTEDVTPLILSGHFDKCF